MYVLQATVASGSAFDFITSAIICLLALLSPFILLGMLIDLIAREGRMATACFGAIWSLGLWASLYVYPRVPEETIFGPEAPHWTWLGAWTPWVWLGAVLLVGAIKVAREISTRKSTARERPSELTSSSSGDGQ